MTSNRNLRDTVHRVGEQHAVPVCDLAAALDASTPEKIAGKDRFIDHCHPNAVGHEILGTTLAECIASHNLLRIDGLTLDTTEPTTDPFRVDHYKGHREIPGIPPTARIYPDSSAEGIAHLGHEDFVADRFDQALQHYERAAEHGAPVSSIQHTIAITELYRGQMRKARRALRKAVDAGSVDAKKLLMTLED